MCLTFHIPLVNYRLYPVCIEFSESYNGNLVVEVSIWVKIWRKERLHVLSPPLDCCSGHSSTWLTWAWETRIAW